jgi:uncharacterized protein YndB with AHSA1/START domain
VIAADPLRITTPSEREVVLTREFDAPRQRVFDALTRPELLRRWYAPAGWSMEVCEVDLRVGGAFSFVSRRADGKQVGQRGEYLELAPPERIVHSERWPDWEVGDCRVTTVLVERDGRTTLTSTILFPSREVRDTILESGLRRSAGGLYDQLAAVLASPA